MGQKVNPVAFRVGVMEGWKSRWYAPKKEFAALLVEDKKIRDYIKKHKEDKEDRKGELSFPGIKETRRHKVNWNKVKGHADNEFNNRCDQLARAEIKKLRETIKTESKEPETQKPLESPDPASK